MFLVSPPSSGLESLLDQPTTAGGKLHTIEKERTSFIYSGPVQIEQRENVTSKTCKIFSLILYVDMRETLRH